MARMVRDKRMTFSRTVQVGHKKGDITAQGRDVSLQEAVAAAERDLLRRVARSTAVDQELHRNTRRARAAAFVAGLCKTAYSRGTSACDFAQSPREASGNAASGPPIHPSRSARRREIALMSTEELALAIARSAPGENLDLDEAFAWRARTFRKDELAATG
ncbi:MAG: hypothetical protein OXH09_04240 [Gammaproteobacteria bacterium]|nr:hypothetical protein [Gammaproteobacteria bacterium]